jgi:transcriptional regulator with XRE-family HTH domain
VLVVTAKTIFCHYCEEVFMVVKKLRVKNNWSQEQLATMCGLSVRTIQRVESGQSASLETLKSLASVFEIDITKLTEEITVIDKRTEIWKMQPLWFRHLFWGVRSRRMQTLFEVFFLLTGVVFLFIEQFIVPDVGASTAFILIAYITSLTIRYGDNKQVW